MKLTFTNNTAQGDINIPILRAMTNGDMAEAILNEFTARFHPNLLKRTSEVREYVKTLNNKPERLYFDPCYDICEDCFICSFEFEN